MVGTGSSAPTWQRRMAPVFEPEEDLVVEVVEVELEVDEK